MPRADAYWDDRLRYRPTPAQVRKALADGCDEDAIRERWGDVPVYLVRRRTTDSRGSRGTQTVRTLTDRG